MDERKLDDLVQDALVPLDRMVLVGCCVGLVCSIILIINYTKAFDFKISVFLVMVIINSICVGAGLRDLQNHRRRKKRSHAPPLIP